MSDATNPAVVPDAQQYNWYEDLGVLHELACLHPSASDRRSRLAAHIERLEARLGYFEGTGYIEDLQYASYLRDKYKAERDALLAEHEVIEEAYGVETADDGCDCLSCRIIRAHDNAERVIRG